MAKYFIDRPIFAWVIALFLVVIGAFSASRSIVMTPLPVLSAMRTWPEAGGGNDAGAGAACC